MGKRVSVFGGLVVLALVVWVYNGMFIGSDHEQRSWIELGNHEVQGQVLACRYFRFRGGVHTEYFWPPGSGAKIYLPDGAGAVVAVSASRIGVTRCPWTEAWIDISPQ